MTEPQTTSEQATGATGEFIERAIASLLPKRYAPTAQRVARGFASALVYQGLVIVPATDVLTTDARAAIDRTCEYLETMISVDRDNGWEPHPEFLADLATLRALIGVIE